MDRNGDPAAGWERMREFCHDVVALRRGGSGEPLKLKAAAGDPADSSDAEPSQVVTECDAPAVVPR